MIDPNVLTNLPMKIVGKDIVDANGWVVAEFAFVADAEFHVLARRAEDFQRRLGVSALKDDGCDKWCAVDANGKGIDMSPKRGTKEWPLFDLPCEAIVNAGEWLEARTEDER